MSAVQSQTKKTITGYHDKDLNRIGVLEADQLPILIDEKFSPFLVTRDHNFVIKTPDIISLINSRTINKKFRSIKQTLATILIVPGLIISILYTLKLLGVFDDSEILQEILTSKLIAITFWLAVLGIMLLWHDYFRTKSHPIKLPEAPTISEKEIEAIKTSGFKFARYVEINSVGFLSEESQDLLVLHLQEDGFYTLKFFNDLLENDDVKTLLRRSSLSINEDEFETLDINKNSIPDYPEQGLRSIILYALEEALISNSREIMPIHFFTAFFRVFPILKKYLQKENSSISLIREVSRYLIEKRYKLKNFNILNPSVSYYKTGGIGKDWVYGYTFVLSHFSTDITEKISFTQDRFGIGHEKEIEAIVSVVGRLSKKNILLIGEAGVGKSSLIKGLAQKINHGNIPPQLKNKRIIQLDINGLIAAGASSGNLEALVQKAMGELERAGNTILYIDEIQEIIPAKAEKSGQSIAGILLPYVLEGRFPIIGTINYSDYKKYFYSNESLRQSFENIETAELSPRDTLLILETMIPQLESNFKLFVTFPAMTAAIELSQRYIANRKLPDSAVRTLEAACSWAQSQKIQVLTNEHVAKYISIQTSIPVESITAEEATRLMNLEQTIKSRVIGQDEAVHNVVETLKRARADIRDPNKPIGVFLFMGPTGTGKTYLAKVVSEEYFRNKNDIIRIDMSEYQDVQSIGKFLGQTEENILSQSSVSLLDKVKSNPFSVVLFDEIEKAHPQVLDLFLQLFDEGRLTSNAGETVSFTNCIIIATSNIGSRILLDALEKDEALWDDAKARSLIELRQAIRPELLNRFDNVIVFAPHSIQNLIEITEILLGELAKRIAEKGITLSWNKTIPLIIADRAQEPGMGARPIRRFIQEKIEGRIATEIISGGLESGATVEIRESWLIGS